MRGRLEYVNKKMKIIRSRSAERIQRYVRPETLYVGQCETPRRQERSSRSDQRTRVSDTRRHYLGPVLGQARALVSCVPSPYDNDVLGFQVKYQKIFCRQ